MELHEDILDTSTLASVSDTPVMYNEAYSNGTQYVIDFNTTKGTESDDVTSDRNVFLSIIGTIFMLCIIFAAILGNILVIISVFRFKNLHIISNSFIASLACADLLVASTVMPFSALQNITGTWLLGQTFCDIFNGNDVLFSTASLLHLCCISIDRYIAVTNPLMYGQNMTKKKVALMLSVAWGASAFISHIPIHTGLYATEEHRYIDPQIGLCEFRVNKIYAIISSMISFWIPAIIMVFTYAALFRIARKQERRIVKQAVVNAGNPSARALIENGNLNGSAHNGQLEPENRKFASEQSAIRRENKAAKTLGLIMSAFLICWLPFFLWYVITNICGKGCPTPDIVTNILFWVGYLNSALNPTIYAFHNKQFRKAFKKLLHCETICRVCRNSCCYFCIRRGLIRRASDPNPNYFAGLPSRNKKHSLESGNSTTSSWSANSGTRRASNNAKPGSNRCNYDTVPELEETV